MFIYGTSLRLFFAPSASWRMQLCRRHAYGEKTLWENPNLTIFDFKNEF